MELSENDRKTLLRLRPKNKVTQAYYKKLPILELIEIYNFLKKSCCTEKGNWSINLYKKSFKNERLSFLLNALVDFNKVYSQRKKPIKKFDNFISKLKYEYQIKPYKKHQSLKLKEDTNYADFLDAARQLKKYIKGNDREFIKVLKTEFNIPYTVNTLLRKYYTE